MFKNNFKIAFRNLLKNRFFSLLNLLGLAVGFAVALTLLLYIKDEISFDIYHAKADQIYRLNLTASYDGTDEQWANVPNISGPTFNEQIKDIEEQVRLLNHNFGRTAFISIADKRFTERRLYWADSSLFQIFDIPLLKGDARTALSEPNTIVISQSIAEKYFAQENPIGKMLSVDNKLDLAITGVFEDLPQNSTLDANMFGSFYTLGWASKNLVWSNASFETYLVLNPLAEISTVEQQMQKILDDAVPKDNQWFSFWLQPLTDIHLYSTNIQEAYSSRLGDIQQIRILLMLALAVLILACFNYINMTTARSQERFHEVGINKTLGATTRQLIGRFYVETGILVGAALLLGLLFIEVLAPLIHHISGKSLSLANIMEGSWALSIPLIWLAVMLGAGLYPVLFLSTKSPKQIIQANWTNTGGNRFFRQTLVVGQFVVCVGLIVCTFVFNRQLQFISQKKLGFEAEQVIAITTAAAENKEEISSLMNAYQSLPEVKSLCRARSYPGISTSGYSMHVPGQPERTTAVSSNHVSEGFDEVLGMNIIAGRSLPSKLPDDTTIQVVINETGVQFLGWTPEEAIGKTPPNLFRYPTTIVGVVEDFSF